MRINGILDPNLEGCAGLEVLMCMSPEAVDQVVNNLLELDCKVYVAQSPEDAMKKLVLHPFHVVVLEESYGMEVIGLIGEMPMSVRREVFFVLVGENVETEDRMQSFALSTNLLINTKDIGQLPQILINNIRENGFFFRAFYQSLQRSMYNEE